MTPATLVDIRLALDYLRASRDDRRYRSAILPPLRFAAVADEAALADFESAHGIRLDPGHRGFLGTIGDGGSGPGFGLLPLARWDHELHGLPPGFLAAPFPHRDAWLPPPMPLHADQERFAPAHVQGSIRLSHLGGGVYDILALASGEVWCDAREQDQGVHPRLDRDGRRLGFLAWYAAWIDAVLLGEE